MIFYYVLLLFLSWPQTRCTEDVDLKSEEAFDQLATASENLAHAVRQSNTDSKNLEEQLPSAPSSVDTEVHYENSNGFVPMLPSASPSHGPLTQNDEQQDPSRPEESNERNAVSARASSDTKARNLEEDLAYSSAARIFLNHPGSLTNRRSFDFQEGRQNQFELLKVTNDTPAVANYQHFYENVRSTAAVVAPDVSTPGRAIGERRGKRIENHNHNYDRQQSGEDPYTQYYSYGSTQDTKKITNEREKVASDYHQQATASGNAGQNEVAVAIVPSSPRTAYETNELANSGTYDSVAEASRSHHRFSRPVVVAEPSGYRELKFNGQLRNGLDAEQRGSRNLDQPASAQVYNDSGRQRSYHSQEDASRNLSDESADYSAEYVERTRARAALQKNRRRPGHPDTSRKLPKEHRGTSTAESSAEEDKQKYNPSKLKSQRYRVKANPWANDPSANHLDESDEDVKYDSTRSGADTKSVKAQHGVRTKSLLSQWNQISPNLEISQSNGFELGQLGKQKYVVPLNLLPVSPFDHATALGSSQGFDMSNAMLQNIITAAPVGAFSTAAPILSTLQKNLFSTPVPDVIVGQNTFHNPVQVLLNGQAGKNAFLPSTMTPVFAVTPGLSPTLQSVQGNVTPRTTFAVTPTPASVGVQPIGAGVQQLLLPQSTVQTYQSYLQTPLQANPAYQIHVNPHGLQGQNLFGHGNLLQTLPTAPTAPEGRVNVITADSLGKKHANLLATASLTVGQNEQKQTARDPELRAPRTKTAYVQATQVVPTFLQPDTTINGITVNAQDVQQLQAQLNKQLLKNSREVSGNAHLPNIGTRHVEIVNPNMKPGDTTAYYPAAVLTTPIPIFGTIAPVTPHTVTLQNYVNSLTETGSKTKQLDLKPSQNQERPMFNPINFVPNIDIIKNQNALNNKIPTNELLQQGLSLVPVMPGGNFFKPSIAAQSELVTKPKLASDLQKYAEEMFKESLKTMYNSQKWNNDRKPDGTHDNSEANDLAKLQSELQKLKASLAGSKYRDVLEAYQSENKLRASDALKSDKGLRKPDPLLVMLEHLLKTKGRGPIHIFHGGRPVHKPKPGNFDPDLHDEFSSGSQVLEYLTPPKSSRYNTKGPYHEKLVKKRPAARYKGGPRKPVRPSGSPPRPPGPLEASASNLDLHLDGTHYHRPSFQRDNYDYDSRHQASSFDAYPTFTTPAPEIASVLREIKSNKEYDINHPRMHNLLGLLMKNKQLPTRSAQNYYRDKGELQRFFEGEKRRLQQQFYSEALRDYMERSDVAARASVKPDTVINRNIYTNGTA